MENIKKIKVMNIAHWSRSGITSLIKTIIKNGNDFDNYFVLLDKDIDFDGFYPECKKKFQLKYSESKISAAIEFIKLTKKINPDIIHAHSLIPLIFSAFFCRKAKIIYHIHCDYPFLTEQGLKFSIKRFFIWAILTLRRTTNIAVSESSSTSLQNISSRRAEYIPNGIPNIGSERKPFSIESCNNRFYSVSRLDIEKNIPYAITLIHELKVTGINLSYDIYGNGSEKDKLTGLIQELNLSDVVKLRGFTDTPESLPEKYDFYFSTSTQEGLSLSALQGFRGCTPVITTPVGQIGMMIKPKHNGFILSGNLSEDSNQLKNIINFTPDALDRIQVQASKLYQQQFTEISFLKKIYFLYIDNF